MKLGANVLRVDYWEAQRLACTRFYGRDASPDRCYVDTVGYALRLIDEDEARLGRKRARSGAERLLRAAGFSDPGPMYAFAMDRRIENKRASNGR